MKILSAVLCAAVAACMYAPAGAQATPDLTLLTANRWPAGTTVLHVRFMDGSEALHDRIEAIEAGPEGWSSASGIRFEFVEEGFAEVRVTFAPGGSWSHVGSYCAKIPQDQPTMQLGWLNDGTDIAEVRRIWLHEAGHALGFMHEQLTALAIASIPWDFDSIALWCAENGVRFDDWQRKWMTAYDPAQIVQGEYDGDSIEHYYIPSRWVLDRIQRGGAKRLSPGDRSAIAAWYGPSLSPWTQTQLPVVAKG